MLYWDTLKRLSVTCVWVLKCKELTAGILDNIINFLHYLFSSGNLTELLWNIPRNHKVNFIRFYLQGVGVKFAQSEYFRNLTFLSLVYNQLWFLRDQSDACIFSVSQSINELQVSRRELNDKYCYTYRRFSLL